MTSVTSQLIEEVTAHAQIDSLEDAREIYADGIYFPNNLSTIDALVFSDTGIGISVSCPCRSHEIMCRD